MKPTIRIACAVLAFAVLPSAALAQTAYDYAAQAEADLLRIERVMALAEREHRRALRALADAENADEDTYLAAWERERRARARLAQATDSHERAGNNAMLARMNAENGNLENAKRQAASSAAMLARLRE